MYFLFLIWNVQHHSIFKSAPAKKKQQKNTHTFVQYYYKYYKWQLSACWSIFQQLHRWQSFHFYSYQTCLILVLNGMNSRTLTHSHVTHAHTHTHTHTYIHTHTHTHTHTHILFLFKALKNKHASCSHLASLITELPHLQCAVPNQQQSNQ